MHPYLWRKGEDFPTTYAAMDTMYKDGEINFNMAFNPYFPQNGVINGVYPDDTKTFLPVEGSTANAHFLAIPYNSQAKAGALVVINFLLSPEAQGRKADVSIWGDGTVLDLDSLSQEQKAYFTGSEESKKYPDAAPPAGIGRDTIKEFHATWAVAIQKEWTSRYVK